MSAGGEETGEEAGGTRCTSVEVLLGGAEVRHVQFGSSKRSVL